jgi:hypothetical protein
MMDITERYNLKSDDEPMIDSWGFIDIINQSCHNIEEFDLTYSGTINMTHLLTITTN